MESTSQPKRKRWLQFGIRTILLLMFLVTLAIVVVRPVIQRRNAVRYLQSTWHVVEMRDEKEWTLKDRVLVFLFGAEAGPVEKVEVVELDSAPESVKAIAQLTELKKLHLCFYYDDVDHQPFRALKNLEVLTSDTVRIKDCSFLTACKNLKTIRLGESEIGVDLGVFGELPNLESLKIWLTHLEITNESLDKLCNATSLKTLDLEYNFGLGTVTDFRPLIKLKQLKQLKGVLNPRSESDQEFIKLLPPDCVVSFPD